jgi:ATP synthase protein I
VRSFVGLPVSSASGLKGELGVVDQRESRSVLAEGIQSASRITTVALGFSMPALLGFGLDRWWGTTPAATITGAILGFVLGMFQTLRLAREVPGGSNRGPTRPLEDRENPGSQKGED